MTVEVEDVVAGRRLDRSVADFVRSCEVLIREQQERASPDNAVIATLCDAVRLAREFVDANDLAPDAGCNAQRAKVI